MQALKRIFQRSRMSVNRIIALMMMLILISVLMGISLRAGAIPYLGEAATQIAAGKVPIDMTVVGSALLIFMILAQVVHLLFNLIELVNRELVHRHKRVALMLLLCIGTSETAFYTSHLFHEPSAAHQQTRESA